MQHHVFKGLIRGTRYVTLFPRWAGSNSSRLLCWDSSTLPSGAGRRKMDPVEAWQLGSLDGVHTRTAHVSESLPGPASRTVQCWGSPPKAEHPVERIKEKSICPLSTYLSARNRILMTRRCTIPFSILSQPWSRVRKMDPVERGRSGASTEPIPAPLTTASPGTRVCEGAQCSVDSFSLYLQ